MALAGGEPTTAAKLPGTVEEVQLSARKDGEQLKFKKKKVHDALISTGIPREELAGVVVALLLEHVPGSTHAPFVAPVTVDEASIKKAKAFIDRGIPLNLAATALVGAAL